MNTGNCMHCFVKMCGSTYYFGGGKKYIAVVGVSKKSIT